MAASRTLELRRSAELLLDAVRETLEEAGLRLADLGGVAALQGPGSFTGLRIGLATVLGWHQALGLPATAVPTLEVLAAAAGDAQGDTGEAPRDTGEAPRDTGEAPRDTGEAPRDTVAAVDALRGDWSAQRFRHGQPVAEAALVSGRELADEGPCRIVGFGVERLAEEPWWEPSTGVELVEPPPLAPLALAIAAHTPWEPERLSTPIYFRPPAVTAPKPG